jgi:hypothetical protein
LQKQSTLAPGEIFQVEVGDSGPVQATFSTAASRTVEWVSDLVKEDEAAAPDAPPPKISPELLGKSGKLDVIIQLVDDYKLPLMPQRDIGESRDDASWQAKSRVIDAEIALARAAHAPSQDSIAALIAARGGVVNDRHWLINAVSATIDASLLKVLEADPSIKLVAPATGGKVLADLVVGRNALNSDPYFNTAGLNGGFIALLDTGVRSTHTLLSGQLSWVRDCVNGTTNNCGTAGPGLTLDPSDIINHGTGVASCMSGNANLGANNRGVSDITMDSFRVVVPGGAINFAAVVRGYQAALAGGDNVVNASFDCFNTTCTDAANSAFDAGLVVIAAAGNSGGSMTNHIGEPATGKKVLAVGALDPTALTRLSYSATGPTSDGRTKPELMAVSGSFTDGLNVASNASNTAMAGFTGTSFSSPLVSGAAGLLSRWLKISFGSPVAIEPGQTYAMLLASGINFSSPVFDNNIGAGQLVMPTNATLYGGKITVTNGQTVDTTISVGAGSVLDAAIWWPEGTTHNDVDLVLIQPNGTVATSSASSSQVWEKVHFSSGTTGNWKIRATGFSVTGTQTVYLAGIRR